MIATLINLNPSQLKSISFPVNLFFWLGYYRSNKYLPLPYSNLYVLGNLLFSEIRFANSYVHIMCLPAWPLLSYMKYDFIPYPFTLVFTLCTRLTIMFTKHRFEYQAAWIFLWQGRIIFYKSAALSLFSNFFCFGVWPHNTHNNHISFCFYLQCELVTHCIFRSDIFISDICVSELDWPCQATIDIEPGWTGEEGGEGRLIRLLLSAR